MTLIDRVRKRAKELDDEIIQLVAFKTYNFEVADDRQLLEDVEKVLSDAVQTKSA